MPRTLQTTRHFHVTRALREQIKSWPPGAMVPTVQELMVAHQASQATIDRALGTLRREGLISRPAGKQRLVVNAAADPALRRIAVVRPEYPSKVFDEVTRAIIEQGRRSDVKFHVAYYRSLETLDLAHATGDNDGAVLVTTSDPYPDHLWAAAERPRTPLVVVQECPENLKVHAVHPDNAMISRMAVEHLVSLGHRRIVFFNNEPATYAMAARRDAWRKAMQDCGLEPGDNLVCDCGTGYSQDSLQAAYSGFGRWLDTQADRSFTAVFVASSAVAGMALMRVLCERNIRVPADVSVIAYCGEEPLGAFTNPPLTTLELDMSAYGREVAKMLDEQFAQADAPRHQVLLAPRLEVRSSTAVLPERSRGSGKERRESSRA